MLADYNFYKEIFVGDVIPTEDEFKVVSSRASDKLAQFENVVTDQESLKKCCCAVAEAIYGYNKLHKYGSSQGKINSESVSGYYSVSYGGGSSSGLVALNSDINSIIKDYLGKYICGAKRVRY